MTNYNKELGDAMGIKFVDPKARAIISCDSDVHVSITNDGVKAYLSFSDNAFKKVGKRVRLSPPTRGKIYIVPIWKDAETPTYTVSKSRKGTTRPRVTLTTSKFGNLKDFLGDHKLRFMAELGAYFILNSKDEKERQEEN